MTGFQVFVVGFEGKTSSIENVSPGTTVQELKTKVSDKTGLDAQYIRLIFASKELRGDEHPTEDGTRRQWTMADYGIKRDSTLTMITR
ncbi:Ubiquitin-60S ribosomal protein L40 [Rhizophlyctis rosea]|uniref:Ubiquitin-60S ribosomal protein L40 n=1 Tax=Rhizophlyctis rosea TaxID=64517 RepID=A0AAD5S9S2_9FUNG|nr:Ubiquitin-60S ribosomal protein L40 [Rhizophlyctis rosea]